VNLVWEDEEPANKLIFYFCFFSWEGGNGVGILYGKYREGESWVLELVDVEEFVL